MECNRDEANRAKEIAERKLSAKDVVGAKKFALKAQNLYPGLDGISQLLATLDVYVAAENKVNGEMDYYGILGVSPSADEDTVRKHYRKLALSLHPDKNKSVGADEAFKYVSEAWSFLSDKVKRSIYDQKRNVRVFKQKNGGSPAAPNGFYNFTKSTTTRTKGTTKTPKDAASATTTTTQPKVTPKTPKYAASATTTTTQPKVTTKTPNNAASATTTQPKVTTKTPNNAARATATQPKVTTKTPNNATSATATQTKVTTKTPKDKTSATVSRSKGTTTIPRENTSVTSTKTRPTSVPSSSDKPMTPNTFWTVCHGCRMQYEYIRMYVCRKLLCPNCNKPFLAIETPPPNTNDSSHKASGKDDSNHKPTNPKVGSEHLGDPSNVQWNPFSKATSPASAVQATDTVQRIYERVKREREEAQAAIKRDEAKKKLKREEGKSKKTAKFSSLGNINFSTRKPGEDDFAANTETGFKLRNSGQVEATKHLSNGEMKNRLVKKARIEIQKKLNEWSSEAMKSSTAGEDDKAKNQNQDSEKASTEPHRLLVPDPDFHDFDRDRTERCFENGQIWAAYDDDDWMPRYYATIRNMISFEPFKMEISWLEPITKNEPEPGLFPGFSRAFGEFKTGKIETLSFPNHFSHKVTFTKRPNGCVEIRPEKGEVWAVYRNWSPEWNRQTPKDVIHKYEIVEVDEYDDEETGVTVTPLAKVAGFKTVFRRHRDPKETRVVSKHEIDRFSHRIPSFWLTGEELLAAPKGCRDLDPAATPPEFLEAKDIGLQRVFG